LLLHQRASKEILSTPAQEALCPKLIRRRPELLDVVRRGGAALELLYAKLDNSTFCTDFVPQFQQAVKLDKRRVDPTELHA
jgi:hypothetical protein